MKKILTVLLLIIVSMGYAEIYVNGVELSKTKAHYIKLNINYNLGKTLAYVDYGQDEFERFRKVTDDKGEKRYFVSEADVLNDFYRNGWKIGAVYTQPGGGSDNSSVYGTTYYILERIAGE